MLIYITDNMDGYVTLRIADCDYAFAFGAFIEKYGSEVRCAQKDVYTVMCDIDNWYMDMFNEGCIRFEFG